MKKVLFLCSGNTCRSPMAACLFNHLCQSRKLPFAACSAGLYARQGSPASDGAFEAMKERGLSLLRHSAQSLSAALLQDASLVLAMSPQHAALCQERFPDSVAPVHSFSPPINDPFCGSLETYRATADALESQIVRLIDKLAQDDLY